MKISLRTEYQLLSLIPEAAKQLPFAASLALNKTAQLSRAAVQQEMRVVFNNPTRWVINSLRIIPSTKTNLVAEVAFKDRAADTSGKTMVYPHVEGGSRLHKAVERRLGALGLLPAGWFAVPGSGARLDAAGNMSRSQISTVLAAIEGKPIATKRRSKVAQAAYFAARRDDPKTRHLQPGVYARTGREIKPVLLFVPRAAYRRRLDFYGIINKTVDKHLPNEWRKAMDHALRTAK